MILYFLEGITKGWKETAKIWSWSGGSKYEHNIESEHHHFKPLPLKILLITIYLRAR